jgi:hypothetical protein
VLILIISYVIILALVDGKVPSPGGMTNFEVIVLLALWVPWFCSQVRNWAWPALCVVYVTMRGLVRWVARFQANRKQNQVPTAPISNPAAYPLWKEARNVRTPTNLVIEGDYIRLDHH